MHIVRMKGAGANTLIIINMLSERERECLLLLPFHERVHHRILIINDTQ